MKTIILFMSLCLISAPCYAGTLGEDTEAFARDNPQGFTNFCSAAAGFYQQRSDFEKAIMWTQRILVLQPDNRQVSFYKAQLLFAMGKDGQCQELLKRLEGKAELKDKPLLVSVRMLLYQSYKRQGALESKEAELEGIVKAKDADIDAYRQLFVMYRISESFDKTIKLAKKAIKAYPEESSFRMALAYAHETKGEDEKALRVYEEYDKAIPNNLTVLSRIVDLQIKLGKFKKAGERLDRIERDFIANPQVLAQARKYRDTIAQKEKVE